MNDKTFTKYDDKVLSDWPNFWQGFNRTRKDKGIPTLGENGLGFKADNTGIELYHGDLFKGDLPFYCMTWRAFDLYCRLGANNNPNYEATKL